MGWLGQAAKAIGDGLDAAGSAIGGAASSAFGAVKDAVRAAILFVYHFAATIFRHVGQGWDWVVNGAQWFLTQVGGWAAVVFATLRHLFEVVIPHAIAQAFDTAVRWAAHELHSLDHLLRSVIRSVEHALSRAIATLERWARAAVRAITHTLAGVLDWVERFGKRAVNLVLHPDRLLQFIAQSVTLATWWIVLHLLAPTIVGIIKGSDRATHEFAGLIEDVLARVL